MSLRNLVLIKWMLMAVLLAKVANSFPVFAKDFPAVPGEYIVKFKDTKSAKQIINTLGNDSREVLREERIYVVKNVGSKKGLTFTELSQNPNVVYIEPNFIYGLIKPFEGKDSAEKENHSENTKMMPASSDEDFGKQWGLRNTGWNSRSWLVIPGKKGEDSNIISAWDKTKGERRIVVAVIDTGIDTKHEDLKDNLWTNLSELNGKAGVDDDGNGYVDDVHGFNFVNTSGAPTDGNGHGTHCAGVIGASHNNIGIAGIMDEVQVMSLKFLSDRGFGNVEWAIKAIDYAIKMKANVMSNSWGGGAKSQALEDAIKRANAAGITFVVAAGNENTNNDSTPTYPASYNVDNVVSVGSYNGRGHKSSFSNYGKNSVHIFAPGSKIYSTYPGDRYKNLSGTSMAAPFVSGAVGLLLSTSEGALTPLAIRSKLMKTATQTADLKNLSLSNGRLNVGKLLE